MFGLLKNKPLNFKKIPRSEEDTTVYACLGHSADKAQEVCKSMGAYLIRMSDKHETKTEAMTEYLKTEEFKSFGISTTIPNDLFFLGMCFELVMTGIYETQRRMGNKTGDDFPSDIKKQIDEAMPLLKDKSPEEVLEALQEIVGDRGEVRAIGVSLDDDGKPKRFKLGKSGMKAKSINNGGIDPRTEN